MKRVFSYLLPYRLRMAVGFLIKVAGTVAELFLPFVLTHILKNVVVRESLTQILLYGALMLALAVAACAFNIIANRMAAFVGRNFSEALRRDLFYRTLTLDAAQTDAFTIPSLESRITTDTYHVHNFVMMIQRMGVRAPILLLGGIVITLCMDAHLALVMLAVLPFIFVTVFFLSRRGVPLYRKVQSSVDGMVRVMREDYLGVRVIKALSKEETEKERFGNANRQLSKNEETAGIVMGGVHPVMTLLMNVGITAVVAIAAWRVSGGTSDPETVVAFMQYFTLISMAMMTVSRMFVMYTKCAASATRIAEVLDTPYLLPKEESPETSREEFIRFDGVSYAYAEGGLALEDVSFCLHKGESLGVIGATGSGKSTLIKLLLRFYDPTAGKIIFAGRPLTSYAREELSAFVGVSHQKDFLYAASVKDNIRFERDLSDEEICRAASVAQAADFIAALPDGFDTLLSAGGTNLSGGQRQRLLIARAVAGSPRLLILDDASSALDYKTDAALRAALRERCRGTTTVTVAQRVSSVKDCSLILVLDEGKVIGIGKHEELLKTCPTYREIAESQMGGGDFDE